MAAKIRVAVIGAGAAGLCAARYLASKQDVFQTVVYERTGQVGGTWVYVEETGHDKYGQPIHSSMYRNLKTNLPKEVMAFPDFPFKASLQSFIGHKDVLQYLEDYANHFNVLKFIKFWTSVENVTPVKTEGKDMWSVEVKHVSDNRNTTESDMFDAIIVCNGHYSSPHIPDIPGLESFNGSYSHSHDYRHPDPYADKTVAVLGGGQSGIDIALDLTKVARKVLLCHREAKLTSDLPSNMEQMVAVSHIKSDNIAVMEDGCQHQVDDIVACTGYDYSFPFLSPECQVTVRDKYIEQLYMHLINILHPTMSFIGITSKICPFPQFALQVRFVVGVLEGKIQLPSVEEMIAEERMNLKSNSGRPTHVLGDIQWDYNKLLVQRGKLGKVLPAMERLYKEVHMYRESQLMNYKNYNFRLIKESWERIEDSIPS